MVRVKNASCSGCALHCLSGLGKWPHLRPAGPNAFIAFSRVGPGFVNLWQAPQIILKQTRKLLVQRNFSSPVSFPVWVGSLHPWPQLSPPWCCLSTQLLCEAAVRNQTRSTVETNCWVKSASSWANLIFWCLFIWVCRPGSSNLYISPLSPGQVMRVHAIGAFSKHHWAGSRWMLFPLGQRFASCSLHLPLDALQTYVFVRWGVVGKR